MIEDWEDTRLRFVKFIVTGVLCLALNTGVIVLLTEVLSLHFVVSIALCFAIVNLSGFLLQRNWVFGATQGRLTSQGIRFLTITVCGTGLTIAGAWVGVRCGIPYWVMTVGMALCVAPLNFIIHALWSFEAPPNDSVVSS